MGTGNDVTAFYITDQGNRLALRLKGLYPGLAIARFDKKAVEESWQSSGTLLFIMATGIVVRTVSTLLKDKRSDPAVIVLDEKGHHVISLLGGHLGGANAKAEEIASFLGGRAVITTGSDVVGHTPIDLWAREKGLRVENSRALAAVGTRLINWGTVNLFGDREMDLPHDFVRVSDPGIADIIVSHRKFTGARRGTLFLRPASLVAGIGCNSGTSAKEIEDAVKETLAGNGLSFLSLFRVATIDRKKEEPGLKRFCDRNSLGLVSFTKEELNSVPGIAPSAAAIKATGARAVAEPSAMLGAKAAALLVKKQKKGNVTVAVAAMGERGCGQRDTGERDGVGRIYVVGTGPGGVEHITPRALDAIRESDVIVGYHTYTGLIRDLIRGKEVFTTGMTREIERCTQAIRFAREGKTTAVISGGDPGIYAMAGLIFELLMKEGEGLPAIPVEVIPGISALNAAAARLGAPIMHDFASISLSNRLTPWEEIEKRLDAAAMADFVIILYNPRSRGRQGQIARAREIILRHRAPATPVGIVQKAMREEEHVTVTTLGAMLDHEIDMQTTVIIGNSKTFAWNGTMITPRGYEDRIDS